MGWGLMGDDRLYIYRHTVTVSSGFVSSVLLTNCAVPRLEEMGDDRLYGYHHTVTVSSGFVLSVLLTN